MTCNLEVLGSIPGDGSSGYEQDDLGEIPEWSKGADCKSVGYAFEGSNPSLPRLAPSQEGAVLLRGQGLEGPFYAKGLRFSCSRCSACCTGAPGHVFLSSSDIKRLSAAFGVGEQTFYERYCRLIDLGDCHAVSLTEKTDNSCEFWGDEGCTVYGARPVQCSSYPFWSTVLASEESWNEEAKSCPGMRNGDLHSRIAIEEALYARRAAGIIRIDRDDAKLPRKLAINRYLGH